MIHGVGEDSKVPASDVTNCTNIGALELCSVSFSILQHIDDGVTVDSRGVEKHFSKGKLLIVVAFKMHHCTADTGDIKGCLVGVLMAGCSITRRTRE